MEAETYRMGQPRCVASIPAAIFQPFKAFRHGATLGERADALGAEGDYQAQGWWKGRRPMGLRSQWRQLLSGDRATQERIWVGFPSWMTTLDVLLDLNLSLFHADFSIVCHSHRTNAAFGEEEAPYLLRRKALVDFRVRSTSRTMQVSACMRCWMARLIAEPRPLSKYEEKLRAIEPALKEWRTLCKWLVRP